MTTPVRTSDQIRVALSKFFGSNAPNVLVQTGSGPQDNIDTYSEEAGRIYLFQTFNRATRSVTGMKDLISNSSDSKAFLTQLQAALELSDDDFNALIDATVEAFAWNYGLTRIQATFATLMLRFFTASSVAASIPLGTTARTAGLNAIEYATSIDVVSQLPTLDPSTGLYFIDVPSVASVAGSSSKVPLNRVTQLIPPITGFSSVTNTTASSGGTDRETNDALLDRCVNSLKGRELDTYYGYDKFLREQTGVLDVLVVANSDPLMVRGKGSELDLYVIAQNDQSATDNVIFNSAVMGTTLILNRPPVSTVSYLTVNGTPQILGVNYAVVKDTGGFAGSNIAVDKIQFLSGSVPTNGSAIHVEYLYNSAISDLQNLFALFTNDVPNSDVLVKQAIQVFVDIVCHVVKQSNYSDTQVQSNVTTSLTTFFSALKLGASVYFSDVVGVIENTAGVDHVDITKMAPVGQTGIANIMLSKNQFARLNGITYT